MNWFSTVVVRADGRTELDQSRDAAGQTVTLRAELDTLILFSATHPLDPAESYSPQAIATTLLAGEPADAGDVCRSHCPENGRACRLTLSY